MSIVTCGAEPVRERLGKRVGRPVARASSLSAARNRNNTDEKLLQCLTKVSGKFGLIADAVVNVTSGNLHAVVRQEESERC